MPLTQQVIDKVSDIMLDWCQMATNRMRDNLQSRLKQNSQESSLAESIVFDGTSVGPNGVKASWNLNDYWVYVDLGVKGVKNKSKTYGKFKFKNMHVSKGFIQSMEDYITRKGIPLKDKHAHEEGKKVPWQQRRKVMAIQMAKAIKKKGITGTRFYSDVFNEQEFAKLTEQISEAVGQEMEVRVIDILKS